MRTRAENISAGRSFLDAQESVSCRFSSRRLADDVFIAGAANHLLQLAGTETVSRSKLTFKK